MHARIVVFGKAELTDRQKQIISGYIESVYGNRTSVEYIYKLGDIKPDDLARVYPVDICPDVEDVICVDFAVFEYDIPWAIVELLKRGIRVVGLITARAMAGDGDIYGGRVKTIGLVEYELSLKKKQTLVF